MAKQKIQSKKDLTYFTIFKSWKESYDLLTDVEKIQFMDNLFRWHNDEEIILNTPLLKMFWTSIEFSLENNINKVIVKSENGSKGGAKEGNKNASKQPNSSENNLNQTNTSENKPNNKNNSNSNTNNKTNTNMNINKLAAVYASPDIIEIENTDIDYMIDETEYEITKPMLEKIIDKFLAVDSRFKFQIVMSEIDEDYGGFDNLIELYLPNDTAAQMNYKKQLQQYKNGIYAN